MYIIERASWVIVGMTIITLYWVGTHNCYETLTGMVCSRHSFSLWDAVEPWLRVVK